MRNRLHALLEAWKHRTFGARLIRDEWLVHRTTRVDNIGREGFKSSRNDTGWALRAVDSIGGVSYSNHVDMSNHFGDQGVVFRARYAWLHGDGQVTFDVRHMYDQHFIKYDFLTECYYVVGGSRGYLYRGSDFTDCVNWVVRTR